MIGATLADYERFHGMLIGPRAARRCIQSLNGRILFMPSTYNRDIDETLSPTFLSRWEYSPNCVSRWNVKKLTSWTYYALVLASFTGLSTFLGLTDVIDAREYKNLEKCTPESCSGLKSAVTPSLVVNQEALDYLVAFGGYPSPSSVRLVRRFEFKFRLSGIHVVMLHFNSLSSTGEVVKDKKGRDILHLVEVIDCVWGNFLLEFKGMLGGLVLQAGVLAGLVGLGSMFLR
mmetsp:Transcript_25205/g.37114  ORF Transcript_25205/g.37114 Transcript_25205/m.37114 type:complete len:231 (-) Transcript_25205:142-834(-)